MEVLYNRDVVLWRCCTMEVLYYGGVVLWRCCTMEVLYNRDVVLWRCCTMEVLYNRDVVLWRCCIMEVLHYGGVVLGRFHCLHVCAFIDDTVPSLKAICACPRLPDASSIISSVTCTRQVVHVCYLCVLYIVHVYIRMYVSQVNNRESL